MLRALLVVVVLANAGFLAWSQGWLAPWLGTPLDGERDPARQAAQVRPEALQVLTPKAASAALAAARQSAEACVAVGPYGDADLAATEQLLLGAGLPRDAWTRRELPADSTRVLLRFERTTPALREQLRALGMEPATCTGA